jgi:hypothetical protein
MRCIDGRGQTSPEAPLGIADGLCGVGPAEPAPTKPANLLNALRSDRPVPEGLIARLESGITSLYCEDWEMEIWRAVVLRLRREHQRERRASAAKVRWKMASKPDTWPVSVVLAEIKEAIGCMENEWFVIDVLKKALAKLEQMQVALLQTKTCLERLSQEDGMTEQSRVAAIQMVEATIDGR